MRYLSQRKSLSIEKNRQENVLCSLFITSVARYTCEKIIAPASDRSVSICRTEVLKNIISIKQYRWDSYTESPIDIKFLCGFTQSFKSSGLYRF